MEREERRLRQKEDVQISAAVYSLEPVDTEANMYASYDAATEQVASFYLLYLLYLSPWTRRRACTPATTLLPSR
jgi:hypothetical protein